MLLINENWILNFFSANERVSFPGRDQLKTDNYRNAF